MAESKCQSYGGDLASIENENERRFIYNEVVSWSSHRFYWIGLNDVRQSNLYEWVCAVHEVYCPTAPVNFFWWASGMPESGMVKIKSGHK